MYLVISLITIIFIVFILCFFLQNYLVVTFGKDVLSMDEYLYFNYGYINYPKTIFFMAGIFVILIGLVFLLNYIFKKKIFISKAKKIILIIFISLSIISLLVFTAFFLPAHCGLNFCHYKEAKNVKSISSMESEQSISFIGIGDTQMTYFAGDKTLTRKRLKDNRQIIKMINLLVSKIKNNDNSNLIFGNDTAKELFNNSKQNLIGLVNPGDIVQMTSAAGHIFNVNNLGIYEYFYNNNPEDKGLLNLSTYEVLGNHGYDPSYKFAKFLNYPAKKAIIRRNTKRKYIVNSDSNGNYSCDFGKLHMIFINLHLSEESMNDLSDKPKTNLKFLKDDLSKFHSKLNNNTGTHRWCIVTHDYNGEFSNNNISKIISNYKDNCVAILCGHVHPRNLISRRFDNNDSSKKSYILPSPAGGNNDEITYFVFNNITRKFNTLKIIYKNEIFNITQVV